MKTYKIVKVEWEDISGYPAWRDIGDIKKCKPLHCVSVGTLMKGKKGCIALSQSVAENRDAGNTEVIPKHNVVSIEVIGKYRL